MVAFVCKEWGDTSHVIDCIVEGKLGKGEERRPIILLVGAEGVEDLFKGLVDTFCLPIGFQVVSGSEVEIHIQCFSKRAEEDGDKLGTAVGGDVCWNTMFGEYIPDEELCKGCGIYGVRSGDKYGLFGQPVDNNKDGHEA